MIKSNIVVSILQKQHVLNTILGYTNLAFQVIQSDIIFAVSNKKERTTFSYTNLACQVIQSDIKFNKMSSMWSYTTELPVIIYRIKIICRRYKSTWKCSQSPHRQYGATQHRNHKLPIQSFAHQYGRHRDKHMGRCDLVPFLRAKKQLSPLTLGPRILIKFPRVGKAIEVKCPTYARGHPPPPQIGLNIDRCISDINYFFTIIMITVLLQQVLSC